MNLDAVLHLIDPKLISALQKIKNDLKKNLIESVPPISKISEGYLMTKGEDVYQILDAQLDFENIVDIIEKSSNTETLKHHLANQIRLKRLLPSEELQLVSNLYRHLKYMSLFYNLCHDEDNYGLIDKIYYMKKVIRYVNSTTFISDQTKIGVASILRFWVMLKKCIDYEQNDSDSLSDCSQVSSVFNVMCNCQDEEYLYEECDFDSSFDYQVMTSTISTNGLELLFSILRHKVPNMNDLELFQQLRKVIEIKHIHHVSESARIFSLPKFKISDHYARLNIV
ncbi:predicted protein [Naegleria gruberi]|uniref:Predicted protein n=1 Tax=Naegleria gruberi TaxID=5762 RepID=D2VMI0_NAEGR|nr:uncharacterized protein NAEGRDRAFT_70143 [Naegleria gruberi]EFC42065.1 predicted protein [Naegleria gruberi]|eukprot:XP_002674809.1 predicted protein [Naegleria gruberi strain NEG-M]